MAMKIPNPNRKTMNLEVWEFMMEDGLSTRVVKERKKTKIPTGIHKIKLTFIVVDKNSFDPKMKPDHHLSRGVAGMISER